MKKLILTLLLATSSVTYAASDADMRNTYIGFCGAFKLLLKDYDGASSVAKMSTEPPLTQYAAKQFISIANTNVAKAYELGKGSCRSIGRE